LRSRQIKRLPEQSFSDTVFSEEVFSEIVEAAAVVRQKNT